MLKMREPAKHCGAAGARNSKQCNVWPIYVQRARQDARGTCNKADFRAGQTSGIRTSSWCFELVSGGPSIQLKPPDKRAETRRFPGSREWARGGRALDPFWVLVIWLDSCGGPRCRRLCGLRRRWIYRCHGVPGGRVCQAVFLLACRLQRWRGRLRCGLL
jgi:hypothetical protein